MDKDDEFQQNLIHYLEGCQKGEFLSGTIKYVKKKIPIDMENHFEEIRINVEYNHTLYNLPF
jgi:hypothetical protein